MSVPCTAAWLKLGAMRELHLQPATVRRFVDAVSKYTLAHIHTALRAPILAFSDAGFHVDDCCRRDWCRIGAVSMIPVLLCSIRPGLGIRSFSLLRWVHVGEARASGVQGALFGQVASKRDEASSRLGHRGLGSCWGIVRLVLCRHHWARAQFESEESHIFKSFEI